MSTISCWNCNALPNKNGLLRFRYCVFHAINSCDGIVCNLVYEREVVKPLELMTKASMQVQMGQFKHIQLDTESGNELGVFGESVYAKCHRN